MQHLRDQLPSLPGKKLGDREVVDRRRLRLRRSGRRLANHRAGHPPSLLRRGAHRLSPVRHRHGGRDAARLHRALRGRPGAARRRDAGGAGRPHCHRRATSPASDAHRADRADRDHLMFRRRIAVTAGDPGPLGVTRRDGGDQRRGRFAERDRDRLLHLRRRGERETHRLPLTRVSDTVFAGSSPASTPARATDCAPTGPTTGAALLRSGEAAGRPLRDGARPAIRLRRPARRTARGGDRHRAADAEGDRRARGTPARALAGREPRLHLRDRVKAFSQANPAIPQTLRGTVAALASPRQSRPSRQARRRYRGTDARRGMDRRTAPRVTRPQQRLGLQSRRLHGARPAAGAGRLGEIARDGCGASRRGHRGRPRRGLQPHGRRRGRRAEFVASRARRRTLLPPRGRRHARQRHRHGQHARTATGRRSCGSSSTPCDAGRKRPAIDGFRLDLAATLGRTDDGFRPDAPLLAAIEADPLLGDPDLHRRAMGHRARRLSTRRISAALARMERPLPRRCPPLLAGRREGAGRARDPARRLRGHLRARRAIRDAQRQFHRRARRVRAGRRRRLRGEAQRGQRREQPRRQQRQLLVEQRRRRARATTRRSARRGAATSGRCSRHCFCRAARQC